MVRSEDGVAAYPEWHAEVIVDSKGNFTIGRLKPGEYRVFSVRSVDRPQLERPGVMAALAQNAKAVMLGENSALTIQIGVSKL